MKPPAGACAAAASGPLTGTVEASPDKSISHRALILAGLAAGESRIANLLESADVMATARAVGALGAQVERSNADWRVIGPGRWMSPDARLDLGNSGTGVRLLMGAAARFDMTATFTGDASLSRRPMGRVIEPLTRMGARFEAVDGDRLPATLHGSAALRGIDYTPPVASAQVKSAVLLAGLGAQGETIVREPRATRDHTETMARLFGADLDVERAGESLVARVRGDRPLTPVDIAVPGDPSSAAFPVAAALISPGSDIAVRGVMTNPARVGLFETLREMGADIALTPAEARSGEATADLAVRFGALRGVDVPPGRAPAMIDEYPILAVLAAFAEGTTRMTGLAELRAKESDRLAGTAALLRANGVAVELLDDGLIVHGRGPEGVPGGGRVETHQDHRLAMAGLVMGLGAQEPVIADDVAMIATSYPGFFDDMGALGARIAPVD
ncbi:3-phosphoshikimate 1-carboxyvinyltransferase [Marinicauda salina]|uniref:3-phosphoshikimate 1-carboxyvinyltransferase n=1 Tax=Marinicauda salina TaxID=2135793 RepID=A0A2U2BY33_9PROT|nr:3-phosphoshikimate 1-carboxyvinyltransferase [Marinicauda salina]PWE18912.1 3-phosphoshikimate 1-carboxyvinyltransferase [Marinicauda salina]